VVSAEAEAAFDQRGHLKIAVIWLVLTLLTAVTVVALFVTLPVLAALVAELFVRPVHAVSAMLAWLLGPMLLISVGWFALRVDEVPGEGVVAAALSLVGIFGLLGLRKVNQRA
jgi:hypothetical protein